MQTRRPLARPQRIQDRIAAQCRHPRLANHCRPAMSTDSALRYEAALKVTGSAVFEVEVPVAGMLHAALVETPISCGDLVSVNATPASTHPGFAAMVSPGEPEPLQPSSPTPHIP